MFKGLVIGAIVLMGSVSNACDLKFEKLALCADIEFSAAPVSGKDSPFLLSFHDLNGAPVALPTSKMEVVLWMPSMGHGSRPTSVTRFERTGAAYVSNAFFMMAGDWEIGVSFVNINSSGAKTVLDRAVYNLDL